MPHQFWQFLSQHLQALAHGTKTPDRLPRNEAVTGKSLLKLQTSARRRKAREKSEKCCGNVKKHLEIHRKKKTWKTFDSWKSCIHPKSSLEASMQKAWDKSCSRPAIFVADLLVYPRCFQAILAQLVSPKDQKIIGKQLCCKPRVIYIHSASQHIQHQLNLSQY